MSDEEGQDQGMGVKGVPSGSKERDRAAPTRRRNFIKDPKESFPRSSEDGSAEDLVQGLTGKRFSLSGLFKGKSKKDASSKQQDVNNESGYNKLNDDTEENEVEITNCVVK